MLAKVFTNLVCDFTEVPDSDMVRSPVAGRTTKRASFTIEMYFGSAHLTYVMTHKDKKCGDVAVEY